MLVVLAVLGSNIVLPYIVFIEILLIKYQCWFNIIFTLGKFAMNWQYYADFGFAMEILPIKWKYISRNIAPLFIKCKHPKINAVFHDNFENTTKDVIFLVLTIENSITVTILPRSGIVQIKYWDWI